MRDLTTLSAWAIRIPGTPPNGPLAGAFEVPCPETGARLRVVASAALGWDHVSVSNRKRCPNWPEMCRVKDLFFLDHECAMQLHVPASDHVNNHPFCLHLFRPHEGAIPRPPVELVGVPGLDPAAVTRMTATDRLAIVDEVAGRVFGEAGATAARMRGIDAGRGG